MRPWTTSTTAAGTCYETANCTHHRRGNISTGHPVTFVHEGVELVMVPEIRGCEGCYGNHKDDPALNGLDSTGCCHLLPRCGSDPERHIDMIFVRKDQMPAYIAHILEKS